MPQSRGGRGNASGDSRSRPPDGTLRAAPVIRLKVVTAQRRLRIPLGDHFLRQTQWPDGARTDPPPTPPWKHWYLHIAAEYRELFVVWNAATAPKGQRHLAVGESPRT